MKKLLLSLALFVPCILSGSPVSETRCRAIAEEFLRSRGVDCTSLSLVTERTAVKSSVDAPAYFIYNTGKSGFVIVSGEDSVPAILGYSDKGALNPDVVPVNFREWMDMWEAIIADCRASNATESSEFLSFRNEVSVSGDEKLQYQTANWGQSDPYNKLCPSSSLSGCGAVATCIVMNYHKWPDKGVKLIPGYVTQTNKYTINKITVEDQLYDWNNMQMNYGSSSTQEQKDAVAALMYEVGVALESDYDKDGTSTSPSDIPTALNTYFKYDASVMLKQSSFYPADKWVEMLKESLRADGPIIYTGQSSTSGGHAFVVDGYEGSRLHINWGWDGSNNGYYTYPNFDTFTKDHFVIFNVKKDEGGQVQDDVALYKTETTGYSGILVNGTIEMGRNFNVDVKGIANYSSKAFDGQMALARVDKNEECQEVVAVQSVQIPSMRVVYMSCTSCVLEGPFNTGDRLMVVYKSSVTPEWTVMRYDLEDAAMIGEIPLADAKSIEESTTLKYVLADRKITLTHKAGVEVQFLDASDSPLSGVVQRTGELSVEIDVSALPSGTYTVKLTKEKELKLIKVKL